MPAADLVARQYVSHILVYTLSDAENININRLPTIRFDLRILEDIYMMLFINGILIHISQLAWAIGHTNNVLTLWTQLFEIISVLKLYPNLILSRKVYLSWILLNQLEPILTKKTRLTF